MEYEQIKRFDGKFIELKLPGVAILGKLEIQDKDNIKLIGLKGFDWKIQIKDILSIIVVEE